MTSAEKKKGELQDEENLLRELRGVEEEKEEEGLQIDRPFDPDKIKVTTEKKNIDLLVRRIDHKEIDLAPEFQRRARLWHTTRKSQLIESLLLRIPLPVFYVAADSTDNWSVVDGLQRITTIYDFAKGDFALSGLEYLDALADHKFDDLDRSMRRRIEETELVINVIQPGTPEEVMINIFKRINTGGVPLNGQEVRNALHKGPVREFLRALANGKDFQNATDGRVSDDRMDAQEMVLRFMAFYLTRWPEYRVNDLDTFLSDTMRKLNQMPAAKREDLSKKFSVAMRRARAIFDRDAFRKPKISGTGRNPVSKPLFEAWSVNLADLTDREAQVVQKRKSEVLDKMRSLIVDDPEFVTAVSYSTGQPQRVTKRFESIKEIIDQVLVDEALS